MTDDRPPMRRPALRPSQWFDGAPEGVDPATSAEVARATADALVRHGRSSPDDEVTQRLVNLVGDVGLATLAELWAAMPARTLPGAMWRLYVLREWLLRSPREAAADYQAGVAYAEVSRVISGVAEPPGPDELRALADAILTGVFRGDLAVALERAAAFCRIVSTGRAHRADQAGEGDAAAALTRRAASLLGTADDLTACATLWRTGTL